MKKEFIEKLVLALFVVCYAVGCEEKEESFPKVDDSLAGSVVFHYPYRILEAECSIGGTDLKGLDTEISVMDVDKVTDGSVRVIFFTVWENDTLSLDIPEIVLNGKRFDVAFDGDVSGCAGELNGRALSLSDVRISGYIRLPEDTKAVNYELANNPYEVSLTVSTGDAGSGDCLEFKVTEVTRERF